MSIIIDNIGDFASTLSIQSSQHYSHSLLQNIIKENQKAYLN